MKSQKWKKKQIWDKSYLTHSLLQKELPINFF